MRIVLGLVMLILLRGACPLAGAAPILDFAMASVTDADADGVMDLFDNAPLVGNTDQADIDGDSFGDAGDPAPNSPNFPLLFVNGPYGVPTGGTLDLVLGMSAPVFDARVAIDLGGDGVFEGFFFGNPDGATVSVPASFFVGSGWDLSTPGVYAIGAGIVTFADGGGTIVVTGSETTFVTVGVPEPGGLALVALGLLAWRPRRRRT